MGPVITPLLIALALAGGCQQRTNDMSLPFSRERTYTDGTPVDPNDLNAIQDAIAAKHNRPIQFGASAFADNGNVARDNDALEVGGTPAVGFIVWCELSPFVIPGDTIKEVTWRWGNGATPTAGAVRFIITRTNVATDAEETIYDSGLGTYDTDTGGAGAVRNQTTAIGIEIADGYFYELWMTVDATGADDGAWVRGATVVLGS
jgi:hypothetical protein